MKRFLFFSITFLLLFAQSIGANDFSKAEISISFYKKSVYYTGNAVDNPINIYITIENKGPETLRFKLADDRAFSLDFNARTVKNEPLKQTEDIIRKRTTNQTVYFRERCV